MMQDQFMQMQDKLKNLEVTGSAGNGLVEITLNGENEVKRLKIKPECVDPEDIEGLEDLLKAAFKDAQDKLKKESSKGAGLPGLGGGMPNLSSLMGMG